MPKGASITRRLERSPLGRIDGANAEAGRTTPCPACKGPQLNFVWYLRSGAMNRTLASRRIVPLRCSESTLPEPQPPCQNSASGSCLAR